jgi:hypothetical protein
MALHLVTIFYTHRDGRTIEACAVIGGSTGPDAIAAAIEAVEAFPHCAVVVGGICEELPPEVTAAEAVARAAAGPNARAMPEPANQTRH